MNQQNFPETGAAVSEGMYPPSSSDLTLGSDAEAEQQDQERNTHQDQQQQAATDSNEFDPFDDDNNNDDGGGDRDSALGSEDDGDRRSLTESVLAYRTINGRRYHADRGGAQHWAANDDAHAQSAELHYYVINDYQNCLFRVPVEVASAGRVLDVGTGNGLWAMDFADLYPNCEIIGTDISSIQPTWVPPNVRFDIEDFTQPWPYADASFDFVHVRLLYGSVPDWEFFYDEAYRVLKPGGWLEHSECEPYLGTNHATLPPSKAISQWNELFREGGRQTGQTFDLIEKLIQDTNFARLGMQDVVTQAWEMPVGGWPKDPRMSFIGCGIRSVLDQDAEGYVTFVARIVYGWSRTEVQAFTAELRRDTGNNAWKMYYRHRLVYGRKPATS